MEKFKVVSKVKKGQKVYTLNEGKIVSGIVTGYHPAIISDRNYVANNNTVEIGIGGQLLKKSKEDSDRFDEYIWSNEQDCYNSERALISSIKKR